MIDLSVWRRRFEIFARSGTVDRVDVLLFGGLVVLAVGVALQFSMAYALIAVGLVLMGFGLLALFSPGAK